MKILKNTLVCLFLVIMGLTAFSGCHTAHGFGEDIESAGEAIQKGTDK